MSVFAYSLHKTRLTLLQVGRRMALPIRFQSRWTYIIPTRYGFVFFGMLLILLFGSINHSNNLGFMLTFMLGGIFIVSIFHTLRNISRINLASVRAKAVFAGQKAVFEITVDSFLHDRPAISFYFPGGGQTTLELTGGRKNTVKVYFQTTKRGLLTLTSLIVSTTYPLGLFRVWSPLSADASCLVYPRPVDGPMITSRGPDDADSEGEKGGAGVEDFAGLETYQHGDSLEHISWKTYSRGQGLYTKKFQGQQGLTIYFNLESLSGQDLEVKLSRLCSMVLKADALHLAYGLRLGNRIIEPGQGPSHKRQCLQELALVGQ